MQDCRCLLCRVVPVEGRRIVYPSTTAAAERVRLCFFHVLGVYPEVRYNGQGTIYACKPCFGKLERGEKQRQALEHSVDEILSLEASAGVPRILIDAGTQTASVATDMDAASSGCTDRELSEGVSGTPNPLQQVPSSPSSPVSTGSIQTTPLAGTSAVKSRKRRHTTTGAPRTPTKLPCNAATPKSLLKVTYMKAGYAGRTFNITTPYKGIVKSLRYGRPGYTARKILSVPRLKAVTVNEVLKVIRLECASLCENAKPSVLRAKSKKMLTEFQSNMFLRELKQRAPTLLSILQAAARSSKKSSEPNPIVICMAAAVLLKQRNQQMCLLQSIVAIILYAGHAAKKVYTRLAKLGVCVSHVTSTRLMKKLAEGYDDQALEWKSHAEQTEVQPQAEYILVGDNIDKNIAPRQMRVDNQVKSLHYFHSYATHDRIDFSHLSSEGTVGEISSLPLSTFVPSIDDCAALRENYIILVARVITEKLLYFQCIKKCVPKHIQHPYSEEMSKPSTVVPLGIIPKNEAKREELTEIMEQLHDYVPSSSDHISIVPLGFGGDQMTSEKTRKCQESRLNSDNARDALLGLAPFSADWHAEVNLLQVMYNRLYKNGTSTQGGTLLQLRNMVNRRNIAANISGRFNAAIDFFELVCNCHIVVAAMHYFGMKSTSDTPTCNDLPSLVGNWSCARQWDTLSKAVGVIVDRYVIIDDLNVLQSSTSTPQPKAVSALDNPHACRVTVEHCYVAQSTHPQVSAEHSYAGVVAPGQVAKHIQEPSRRLPAWLLAGKDRHHPSNEVLHASPDGVFNYASAVLNDGLFMLELRDAIHEGDAQRILRCWKFMLLYFRSANRYKYALEVVYLIADVNALLAPRLAQQIMWSRVVNPRGGAGNNIPVDLLMEHLNRHVKDFIIGLGANVSEATIVNCSKSLKGVTEACENFDQCCGVSPTSMHHTQKSSKPDEDKIIEELSSKSRVFDYVPGRHHPSFQWIEPHISREVNATALFTWLQSHKKKIAEAHEFQKIMLN